MDGTGLAMVRNAKQQPDMFKRALASSDYLNSPVANRLMHQADNVKAALGHTRHATQGSVNDANAHPFTIDHITLAHNGGINNYKSLGLTLLEEPNEDVDSAHVAAALALKGEIETLERVIGDYCFIWHNQQDGTLNIAKNKGRPLYWMEVPEWEGIVWGSEMEMLGWLLMKNNIKTKGKFLWPSENVLYKFDLNSKTLEYKDFPFEPRRIQVIGASHTTHNSNTAQTGVVAPSSSTILQTTNLQGGTHSSQKMTDGEIEKKVEAHLLRNQYDKREGRPTSRKQLRKAIAALLKLGISYDSKYGCDLTQFELFKNQRILGVATGTLNGSMHKKRLVEVHGVEKTDFDVLKRNGRYALCHAINVKHYKNIGDVVVMALSEQTKGSLEKSLADTEKVDRAVEEAIAVACTYPGPKNIKYSYKSWRALVNDGCVNCQGPIYITDADSIIWIGATDDQPLCPGCASSESTLSELGINVLTYPSLQ